MTIFRCHALDEVFFRAVLEVFDFTLYGLMKLYRYLFILMGVVFKGQFQDSVFLLIGKGQGVFRRRRQRIVFFRCLEIHFLHRRPFILLVVLVDDAVDQARIGDIF